MIPCISSACGFADCPFVDQAFSDELVHQQTNPAARQLHSSRQVCTRNRLMLADEIQQNAPIDLPGGPTCGNAKILRVDFAQTESVLHEFVQVSANISQRKFRGQSKSKKQPI